MHYHHHSQIGMPRRYPPFVRPPRITDVFDMSETPPSLRSPYAIRAWYYLNSSMNTLTLLGKRKYDCDMVDPPIGTSTPQKEQALEIPEQQQQQQQQQEEENLLLEDLDGYLDSLDPSLFDGIEYLSSTPPVSPIQQHNNKNLVQTKRLPG